jgi:hypothetical protein
MRYDSRALSLSRIHAQCSVLLRLALVSDGFLRQPYNAAEGKDKKRMYEWKSWKDVLGLGRVIDFQNHEGTFSIDTTSIPFYRYEDHAHLLHSVACILAHDDSWW